MPTEHISYSYRYAELDEAAQRKAVETVADKLGGDWWDQHDNDDVADTMRYKLAEVLQSPGWDTFGEGNFPGIDTVTLDGWDLYRDYACFKGTLTRRNAPGLAWPAHADHVELTSRSHGTGISVNPFEVLPFICTRCGSTAGSYTAYDNVTAHIDADGYEIADGDHAADRSGGIPVLDLAALGAFEQTVRDALSAALKAGRDHAEYKSSEEAAKDYIESNDPDFTEAGELF